MKYQIIHAFASHNDELEEAIEAQLSNVIDNYPFEEQIQKEAYEVISDAISRSIKDYFLFGDGFNAIDESVKKVIQSSLTKKLDND